MILRFFLFFVFLFSGFYTYYLYKYPTPYDASYLLKHYQNSIIVRQGAWLNLPKDRTQHFKNFPYHKDKNAIRIGAFGDSHTYGSEVGKTESYPYHLQKIFKEKSPNIKIEILNFGIGGAGFQEQFFLWEAYRKKYRLDYILLGPRGFYTGRDSIFHKKYIPFSYPKNRYVLGKNENSIKEVFIGTKREGVEDSLEKRFKTYYKLIPSWTALRYDKKPFQIWEFLLPFFRNKLSNPFYYTNLPEEEEIPQINKFLLERIRKEYNKKTLFLTDNKGIFNNYKSVKNKHNLNKFPSQIQRFYYMFEHESSLGNEYIAKVYFNALIGKKEFSLKRIKCFSSEKAPSRQNLNPIKLSLVKSIQIIERNNLLSILKKNSPYREMSLFREINTENIQHFISFFSKDDFLNSPFFPIKFSLKEGQKLYLKLNSKNTVKLGEIKALDSHKKFFYFIPTTDYRLPTTDYIKTRKFYDYSYWDYSYLSTYFHIKKLPTKIKEKLKNRRHPIDLLIGEHSIGNLYPELHKGEKIFSLFSKKQHEESFLMMGPSSGFAREKNFKDEFSPSVLYLMKDGTKIKSPIPDWKCKKVKDKINLELPNFEPIKLN